MQPWGQSAKDACWLHAVDSCPRHVLCEIQFELQSDRLTSATGKFPDSISTDGLIWKLVLVPEAGGYDKIP